MNTKLLTSGIILTIAIFIILIMLFFKQDNKVFVFDIAQGNEEQQLDFDMSGVEEGLLYELPKIFFLGKEIGVYSPLYDQVNVYDLKGNYKDSIGLDNILEGRKLTGADYNSGDLLILSFLDINLQEYFEDPESDVFDSIIQIDKLRASEWKNQMQIKDNFSIGNIYQFSDIKFFINNNKITTGESVYEDNSGVLSYVGEVDDFTDESIYYLQKNTMDIPDICYKLVLDAPFCLSQNDVDHNILSEYGINKYDLHEYDENNSQQVTYKNIIDVSVNTDGKMIATLSYEDEIGKFIIRVFRY